VILFWASAWSIRAPVAGATGVELRGPTVSFAFDARQLLRSFDSLTPFASSAHART
jgi:hypothetical protein